MLCPLFVHAACFRPAPDVRSAQDESLAGGDVRLGIISDAHHYKDEAGRVYVITPLARQFEQWATLFDSVAVCAPLLDGRPPATCSAYQTSNLTLLAVPNAGGNTLRSKLKLAWTARIWWRTLRRLAASVDAVHVRCPNNISILGLLVLRRAGCLCQALYTGSWQAYPGEPLSYRWQRWFLRTWFRGPVAVYGDWPDQPPHIVPSFSPSYALQDWQDEHQAVSTRLAHLAAVTALPQPIKMLSVGHLTRNKNQQLVIRALEALRKEGVRAELHLVGDGVMRDSLQQLATQLGLSQEVIFHGQTPHLHVRQLYRDCAFVIQAPYAEGYGKVPIEAFVHGAIPILSDVNLSRQLVDNGNRGRCFPQGDVGAVAQAVVQLAQDPQEMIRLIKNGRAYARSVTLEAWRDHLRRMLEQFWSVELGAPE